MRKALLLLLFLTTSLGISYAQRNNNEALARQYYNNTEYDKAEDLFEKLLQDNPDNNSYYDYLIKSYLNQKKYSDAEKMVRKFIKRSNNYSKYHIDLGNIYDLQNQKEKANKSYNDAIKYLVPDIGMAMEVCNTFIEYNLLDFALQTVKHSRKIFNNPTILSVEASKIYSLQNNKKGLIEEQLSMFEANEFDQSQIQQVFQDYFNDPNDYNLLKLILLEKLQKEPDQIFYSDMLIWTFIQQENYDAALLQSIAIDKRLNENGTRLLNLGKYAMNNLQYDVANKAFQEVINKGFSNNLYFTARKLKLNNQNEKIINSTYTKSDLDNLKLEYQSYFKELGENAETFESMKDYAQLLALYLNEANEAIIILERIIENRLGISSFIAACKLDLGDYYLIRGDIWDAALLYGQVDKAYKDEPIGQLAKFKNAKLSYYAAEFSWAKAQLDILKSGTSNLIANDALNLSLLISDNEYIDTNLYSLKLYAQADLLVFQHKYNEAIIKLDSINILFPNNDLEDDILFTKSTIDLQKQDFTAAIVKLNKIADNYKDGIWADDAIFKIAELYQYKLANQDLAMQFYKKLIDEFPGSLYVVEARKRFRLLRGS
jgi:tetratricopeptide (TPR) repeat protein